MQSVSSRIWTRVAVSISYDDNNYTTGTSKQMPDIKLLLLHSNARKHLTVCQQMVKSKYNDSCWIEITEKNELGFVLKCY